MKADSILKTAFVVGAVVDAGIAVTWFLIASGQELPNILSGYTGSGADYRFAMYVAAMFVSAWAVLLAWGARRPVERRGLLLITAGFLVLSVIIEFLFFHHLLGGAVFWFGVTKRLVLSALFIWVYSFSLRSHPPGSNRKPV